MSRQPSPPADRELVAVGRTLKPHGLRGEIRVHSYADSPSLFASLPALWLRPGSGRLTPVRAEAWRVHQGAVLLKFAGIDDRTAAEAWRDTDILAAKADLPAPEPDEPYLFELLETRVELPDGRKLGRITAVTDSPQELWTITTGDGREILFPAQPEFVLELDIAGGRVVIDPPEGLLDIYLKD